MATSNTLELTGQLAKLSSKVLKEKTGRDWDGWIDWLDDLQSEGKTHREIVSMLSEYIHSPWYRQKIALGYREAKGQRELGQLDFGYEIGVSKTFPIHLRKAWEILTSKEGTAIWLGDLKSGSIKEGVSFETTHGIKGSVTVLEDGSHFRMTWQPSYWRNSSTLQVRVTGSRAASAGKSVISFHHEKLPRAFDRAAMKKYWEEKLSGLAEIIKGKSGSL